MKSVLKEVEAWREAGVITDDVAERIRAYYRDHENKGNSRLTIAFGILGALLVGLGLLLLVAHNWDTFPKGIKLTFAFLPLLATQGVAFVLIKRDRDSAGWREGCATLLTLSIAISISLVSQVYNINGDLAKFLEVWMILSLPVIYVLRSSMTLLLYVAGVTWFGLFGYEELWRTPTTHAIQLTYGILLIAALPWYVRLIRTKPGTTFTCLGHWFFACSVTLVIGTVAHEDWRWLGPAYVSLFGIFILLGQSDRLSGTRLIGNGFLVLGTTGTLALLFFLTFDDYWKTIGQLPIARLLPREFYAWCVLSGIGLVLLMARLSKHRFSELHGTELAFLLMVPITFLGFSHAGLAQSLVNGVVLMVAVATVWQGATENRLGRMNVGLLILTALVVCRFFDTNLSFLLRGIIFMAVGAGFFAANFWMVKKRNAHR
jgi:uncharacterized membrane protein